MWHACQLFTRDQMSQKLTMYIFKNDFSEVFFWKVTSQAGFILHSLIKYVLAKFRKETVYYKSFNIIERDYSMVDFYRER